MLQCGSFTSKREKIKKKKSVRFFWSFFKDGVFAMGMLWVSNFKVFQKKKKEKLTV